jgi:hypothetical protein
VHRQERAKLKTDPRWDELMDDILAGKFGDAEFFKPLVESVHDMTVRKQRMTYASVLATSRYTCMPVGHHKFGLKKCMQHSNHVFTTLGAESTGARFRH